MVECGRVHFGHTRCNFFRKTLTPWTCSQILIRSEEGRISEVRFIPNAENPRILTFRIKSNLEISSNALCLRARISPFVINFLTMTYSVFAKFSLKRHPMNVQSWTVLSGEKPVLVKNVTEGETKI